MMAEQDLPAKVAQLYTAKCYPGLNQANILHPGADAPGSCTAARFAGFLES